MAGAGAVLAAVLGTGQTKYVAKRQDVSMNGLVREAIDRALADSGSTFDDIDAVVVGKAPDFFEGVIMPELFMADAMGATGKPLIRVHTAGSVGGSTGVVAASLVQSGKFRRVLAMAWEKQSESNAMWALSIPIPFIKPVPDSREAEYLRERVAKLGSVPQRRRNVEKPLAVPERAAFSALLE